MISGSRINQLCQAAGYDYSALLERNREERKVFARYLIMDYLTDFYPSYTDIARMFNLDRSMIYHAKKQINAVLSTQTPKWAVDTIKVFKAKIEQQNELENDFCPFIEPNLIEQWEQL